jgi:hypothetical protein
MGILDWFKGAAADRGAAPPPPDDGSAEVEGLNFMTAIDAHMRWKNRLESYIQGTSEEDLKVETVCRDDLCPLGKWIYGHGSHRFTEVGTFTEMKDQHALFHTCAGKVLAAAQEGRKDEALRMLQHGDYVRASERVKMLLAKLYVQIAEKS